jgi:hypothetical protein
MFKHLITFLTALLFTVSVSAQTPAPKKETSGSMGVTTTVAPNSPATKKEEPKAPTAVCVEKDKNGKAIIDAKTNKPVVCPKKDEKKK